MPPTATSPTTSTTSTTALVCTQSWDTGHPWPSRPKPPIENLSHCPLKLDHYTSARSAPRRPAPASATPRLIATQSHTPAGRIGFFSFVGTPTKRRTWCGAGRTSRPARLVRPFGRWSRGGMEVVTALRSPPGPWHATTECADGPRWAACPRGPLHCSCSPHRGHEAEERGSPRRCNDDDLSQVVAG